MGARIAVACAFTLHDSNRRPLPLEFSLAPIFPSRTGDLRGGSLASEAGVTDPGYSSAWTSHLARRGRIDLPHDWLLRFAAQLDFDWFGCGLGFVGILPAQFRFSIVDARRDHLLRLARHVSLHPDKLRSSQIQFFSSTA